MFRKLTSAQLAFDITVPIGLVLLGLWIQRYGDTGGILVTLGMGGALVFWRLAPAISLTIAWVVALLQVLADVPPHFTNLAILIVLCGTGAYGSRAVRWAGFASTFIGAFVITLSVALPEVLGSLVGADLSSLLNLRSTVVGGLIIFITATVAFLLSWTVGVLWSTLMRSRANRRAAVEAEQEVAAEQERTRIARDMHDVVAHSLAVVVAQADGARYIAKKDPDATEAALITISTTAREALSDVRVLLAQLRHSQDDGPQPTLVDLERLFEQLRAAGLTIVEEISGTALSLGTSQQLAVYRIVQESLTNALRHAEASEPVRVLFAWTPHGLDLSITSVLKAPTGRTGAIKTGTTSMGHGVAGMTERALLVGGHLTAGPEAGHYVVRAWLPAHPITGELSVQPAEAAR